MNLKEGSHFMEHAGRSSRRAALLAAVLLGTGLLSLFGIWHGASANIYYAAAVKSMLQNFHNFFFLAFDPGGFVSVDKPPAALWLQALFALAFGLHDWSLILPQALAAVATAAVLYRTVARAFGFFSGLLAAAALGVTPVFIALARSSNVDSVLLLVMTLAASQLLRAAETGRTRHLLAAMALAGLGYNVKMLAAFMILPAFYVTWLWASKGRLRARAGRLLAATGLLLAVALSWSLAVDLTPAADRPYVGSSRDNSEIGLALGYNGAQRLVPGLLGRPSAEKSAAASSDTAAAADSLNRLTEVGQPGPLRLLDRELGSQISWFWPAALLGAGAALAELWRRRRRDPRFLHLLFWLSALFPMVIYYDFSTGYIHRYYLGMLAPCLAALTGIGVGWLWRLYRGGGRGGLLLPVAMVATVCLQTGLMMPFFDWSRFLIEIAAVAGAFGAAGLVALRRAGGARGRAAAAACAVGLAGLFCAPAAWSASAILYPSTGANPMAGPLTAQAASPVGGTILRTLRADLSPAGSDAPADGAETRLKAYLLRQSAGSRYLAAADNAADAEELILETGRPVIAVGGFSGNDPILTEEGLRRLVAARRVRYFIVDETRVRHLSGAAAWAVAHGKAVPAAEYGGMTGLGSRPLVYDLSGIAAK